MRKQRIRLSEATLHNIIRKCVNEAVNRTNTNQSNLSIEQKHQLQEKLYEISEEHFDGDLVAALEAMVDNDMINKEEYVFLATFLMDLRELEPMEMIMIGQRFL